MKICVKWFVVAVNVMVCEVKEWMREDEVEVLLKGWVLS